MHSLLSTEEDEHAGEADTSPQQRKRRRERRGREEEGEEGEAGGKKTESIQVSPRKRTGRLLGFPREHTIRRRDASTRVRTERKKMILFDKYFVLKCFHTRFDKNAADSTQSPSLALKMFLLSPPL